MYTWRLIAKVIQALIFVLMYIAIQICTFTVLIIQIRLAVVSNKTIYFRNFQKIRVIKELNSIETFNLKLSNKFFE